MLGENVEKHLRIIEFVRVNHVIEIRTSLSTMVTGFHTSPSTRGHDFIMNMHIIRDVDITGALVSWYIIEKV